MTQAGLEVPDQPVELSYFDLVMREYEKANSAYGVTFEDVTGATQMALFGKRPAPGQSAAGTGGAAGEFGGVQNCEGTTLDEGASCVMAYSFAPTAPTTRSWRWMRKAT